ncbi:MAG: hypothetical protein O7G31_03760 [Calditrichaeota bacterium]|nr:hypothetical protein [Calditrichota bacterium]
MKTVLNFTDKFKALGVPARVGFLAVALVIAIVAAVAIGLKSSNPWTEIAMASLVNTFRQDGLPGTEEFGLTKRELVESISAVEGLIAKCMADAGFEYVAADYKTIRRGMKADKSLPGLSEKGYIKRHGFGISTMYTGKPPQQASAKTPAKIGLGEQNVRIFNNLSPADQIAYTRTLLGENVDATFAVAIEIEDFSGTGGCTRKAIEQVFKPEQMKATYVNPLDALVYHDPRVVAALVKFTECMNEAGFDYSHPDHVERDIRKRLYAITDGLPVEKLSAEARAALKKLQEEERAVSVVTYECEDKFVDPAEEKVEREMYARPPK